MSKIVILDDKTANQIAAGEVIERPASVVKEMAENAIDAGATAITVEIRNGGVSYIRVTDNGSGMEGDDVEIAFERHATSKIRRIEDLDGLATMGFRGEALASIAAVSHLEVRTKTEDAPHGALLKMEGGRVIEAGQTGCPNGTTFTVRNLFFNTPARYKFLKKDTTEAGYVSDMMERLALSHPEISFKLIVNGQVQHHTPGNNDLISVIYSIYGKEVAKSVIPVRYEENGMGIDGYIGKPEIARGTRNSQSVFINGRFIRSRVISSALEDAYKTVLMQHKFPFCVLNLKTAPENYDVNVHPQKLEVRFANDSALYSHVFHAVKNALMGVSLIREYQEPFREAENQAAPASGGHKGSVSPGREPFRPSASTPSPSPFTSIVPLGQTSPAAEPSRQATNEANRFISQPAHEAEPSLRPSGSDSHHKHINPYANPQQAAHAIREAMEMPFAIKAGNPLSDTDGPHAVIQRESLATPDSRRQPEMAESGAFVGNEEVVQVTLSSEDTLSASREAKAASGAERLLEAEIVGQAFDTYIILQHGEDLLLIDQHAAHERIRYETLRERLAGGEAVSQTVLEPYILKLTALEFDFAMKRLSDFQRIGFDMEQFGPSTLMIRGVPDVLAESFSASDFSDVLDRWMETSGEKSGISDEALYMMSCKSALKANQKLHRQEIQGLLEALSRMENPYTCVHGRPVIMVMTQKELEKRFKRIV